MGVQGTSLQSGEIERAAAADKRAAARKASAAASTSSSTASADDAFLSRVKLNETDSWCYHEGSYSHNPEYGSTHTLSHMGGGGCGGALQGEQCHTKTDYEQGGNVRKSAAKGAKTFWRIHTAGESQVPKEVSATEAIGHSHEVKLEGDKLTVTVRYQETGESKTTELSASALWEEYRRTGKTVEFKY